MEQIYEKGRNHRIGKTASTSGKKPQVYRVIILKQMADHRIRREALIKILTI